MSNDAHTVRSDIERIDWANIAHLVRQKGQGFERHRTPKYDGETENVTEHVQVLEHHATDRRRKVRQVFTVSLVESPLEDGQ